MADVRTSVGYSVNVSKDDVVRAIKTIALRRLLEKSPGLTIDAGEWNEEAEVFLPEVHADPASQLPTTWHTVQVNLAKT